MEKYLLYLLVLFCALLGSLGQTFFKIASKDFSFSFNGLFLNFHLILGIIFYGTSALLFVYSLKFGELSILYPIIATSYIFVTILSFIVFKESLNLYKILGVLAIIFGIWLITK
ncbi:MAG: EamA family transporter [Candidatus Pacearchaeota archaeon]